ncbi:hypothetical protein CPC08DRAFT_430371 [Agrocybe pediades]|nr:hypothetical protein CPC08DRAFT_430371 [Agrocybe pediades]
MSSSSASPSPSQSTDTQPRPPATSSTLYLVTFLATLFLLLFVSCAIVLRSYILRRRYQRRLDEAMASGMFLAPRTAGSKRKRLGPKPKLYDTWLAPTASGGGVSWSDIMPLAARPLFFKPKKSKALPASATSEGAPGNDTNANIDADPLQTQDGGLAEDDILDANDAMLIDTTTPNTPQQVQASSSSMPGPPPRTLRARMRNVFSRNRPSESETDLQTPRAEAETVDPLDEDDNLATPTTWEARRRSTKARRASRLASANRLEVLQVSVLIAMPSQSRPARKKAILENDPEDELEYDDDEEASLPELVFGVARIDFNCKLFRQRMDAAMVRHKLGAEGRTIPRTTSTRGPICRTRTGPDIPTKA